MRPTAAVEDPAADLDAFGIHGRVVEMAEVGGAWSNRVYRGLHRWVDGRAHDPCPASRPVAEWPGRVLATLHGLDPRPVEAGSLSRRDRETVDRWPELVSLARDARARWAGLMIQTEPLVQASLDWIRFNVERALGVRTASPPEQESSGGLVAGLLQQLPHQAYVAQRAPELLLRA